MVGDLLKNKVIVIIGAAGLIGREFVRAVLEHGGRAVIADYNEEASKKLLNEYESDNISFIKLDITNKNSVLTMIEQLKGKYGQIDGVVNSAYPRNNNYGRKLEEVEFDDFCANVNLHLGGYFLVSQQMAIFFKQQGHGNIINISSIYGVISPDFSIYSGTDMTMPVEYAAIKSAIIHLTKYIAKYYKGHNIRANCISPGGVENGQSESFLSKYRERAISKGMLDAGDLVGTLLFLLSDMSSYINGQNIIVDDGFSL